MPFLYKAGATRQIKIIRGLVGKGHIQEAETLLKKLDKANVLKKSGPGTQIRHIGGGGEGWATVVAGAKDAPAGKISLRKSYDPNSAFVTKRSVAEKFNALRRVAKKGPHGHAKLYSKKLGKGKKGGRYMISEYVEPQSGNARDLLRASGIGRAGAKKRFKDASRGVGMGKNLRMRDGARNSGNHIIGPTGEKKLVDFLLYRKGLYETPRKNFLDSTFGRETAKRIRKGGLNDKTMDYVTMKRDAAVTNNHLAGGGNDSPSAIANKIIATKRNSLRGL